MNFKYANKIGGSLVLGLVMLGGCKSKQDAAVDQAKKQAAATGQPQQVVSNDGNGNITTTTVQPPAPGQTAQAVTTTTTPAPAAAPVAANTPATAPGGAMTADSGQATTGAPVTAGQTDSSGQPVGVPAPGEAAIVRPADVKVAAGTNLVIRINQHISVKTSHAGDRFTGEVVEPVVGRGDHVVIPKGAPVNGVVVASHRRGHFKGSSILELRLTYLTLNGTRYALDTSDLTQTKKGKGKRSAAIIGGGAGAGMLIGGIATGGVGLLVGGLVGGGGGTLLRGFNGERGIES